MPSNLLKNSTDQDPIASALTRYAQNILVLVFGLLPIFFIPSNIVPFEYTKIFFVIIGIACSLVLYSLSIMRSGTISVGFSYTIVSVWAVAIVALISSLLSGDLKDSLVGDIMSIHSATFLVVLAMIISVWSLIGVEKVSVMRLYVLLACSTLLLVSFHVARIVFGAEALSFGVFSSATASPFGSWNDLALFFGLSIILSLVALEHLSLTKYGRALFGVVICAALFMLGIINFFVIWVILGILSLVMVVYSIGKERLSSAQLQFVSSRTSSPFSLLLSLVVFAVSVVFIVGGSELGQVISRYTNISYVEVRPSFESTADIARQVYTENAFLGTGPNKFIDAWRLYKDPIINTTVFWNTDFPTGNAYVTTFFVTTGVFGGLVWLIFFGTFIISTARALLSVPDTDRTWYFIGVSSFVSAVYLWGISLVYVPGATILILASLCTGISLASVFALRGQTRRTFHIVTNRRTGLLVTFAVIVIIIGSVSSMYGVGRNYASAYVFNNSTRMLKQGADIDTVEQQIARAYALFSTDIYVRRIAEYEFARMSNLLASVAPTEVEQKQFEAAVVKSIRTSDQARLVDSTEYANWATQGGIYSLLTLARIEGAYERGRDALAQARSLNPMNPIPYLASAELEGRAGNIDAARSYVESAIKLKPNFTDAFFYLSQIDIAQGNIEGAIRSTQSIITLDPNNPARYYQLGILEGARNNIDGTIVALERAIELDSNYANARYLLARAYDLKGRTQDTKIQLEKVLELNPGNAEVQTLIEILGKNGTLRTATSSVIDANRVEEPSTVSIDENGVVSTNRAPESSVITTVNTAPTIADVSEEPKPSEESSAQ